MEKRMVWIVSARISGDAPGCEEFTLVEVFANEADARSREAELEAEGEASAREDLDLDDDADFDGESHYSEIEVQSREVQGVDGNDAKQLSDALSAMLAFYTAGGVEDRERDVVNDALAALDGCPPVGDLVESAKRAEFALAKAGTFANGNGEMDCNPFDFMLDARNPHAPLDWSAYCAALITEFSDVIELQAYPDDRFRFFEDALSLTDHDSPRRFLSFEIDPHGYVARVITELRKAIDAAPEVEKVFPNSDLSMLYVYDGSTPISAEVYPAPCESPDWNRARAGFVVERNECDPDAYPARVAIRNAIHGDPPEFIHDSVEEARDTAKRVTAMFVEIANKRLDDGEPPRVARAPEDHASHRVAHELSKTNR